MPSQKTFAAVFVVALALGAVAYFASGERPYRGHTEQQLAILDYQNEREAIRREYEQSRDWQAAFRSLFNIDTSGTPTEFQQAVSDYLDALLRIADLYAEIDQAAGAGTVDLFLREDFDATSEDTATQTSNGTTR